MGRILVCSGRKLATAATLLAIALGSSRLVLADESPVAAKEDTASPAKSVETKKSPAKRATAAIAPISPEREAAAIEFAQRNHPELESLLQTLKQRAPKEYQAALTDLDRTVERLSKWKDKSSDRYQAQLTDWKVTSRVQLLAARLALSDDAAVENELRTAVRDRLELRLSAQRAERDRLRKRVEKLDQVIDETSSQLDAQVESQIKELRTSARAAKAPAKSKARKPARAVPVDATEQK